MFDPDDYPVKSDPMDDEFDGDTLNSKWTIWNQPAGGVISVANSHLIMTSPYNVVSRVFAILQPVPSGNWRFRAKLVMESAQMNYMGVGLILRRITTADKSYHVMSLMHTGQGVWTRTIWALAITGTTMTGEADLYNHGDNVTYMEVENDGTDITWRISFTGAAYSRIMKQSIAGWPGSAFEYVGINFHNYSGATAAQDNSLTIACDWFRRMA